MQETEIHREVFGKCVQDFDTRERLASTVDSLTATRRWLYTCRSELAGAWNDSAGNRTASSAFDTLETYAANNLNQYTSVNRTISQSDQSNNFTYDADGNLTNDGRNAYAYDDENRFVSVMPRNPSVGSRAIENAYDHRNRRVRKTVKRCLTAHPTSR